METVRNVTIKQLRSFVTIAQERSFTRAAGRMNVSQSALTIAIRDLEREVGMPLFDRTTRSVELTAQGTSFLPVARRMLDELSRGLGDLRALAELQKGMVVVTAASAIINVVLAPAVQVLAAAHPRIAVRIIEDTTERLASRVLNGEADFGITTLHRPIDDIERRLLLRDRLGVLCPKGHPLALKSGDLTWSDLAKYPLAALGPEGWIRTMLDNDSRVASILPQPMYEVSSVSSLLALVEAGVGIGVFPGIVACPIMSKDLVFRPILRPVLRREVFFIKRKRRSLTPAANELANCVFEQFRKLQEVPSLNSFADVIAPLDAGSKERLAASPKRMG